MRTRYLLIVLSSLVISTTVVSQNDNAPQVGKNITLEDSLFYESLKDSAARIRSGLTGDNMQNPIDAGIHTSDFFFSDTKNTSEYSDQYGRYTYDVFYRLVLSVPMNVTFTNEGSDLLDTYLYLLDSSGNLIEANDDYYGESHCSDGHQSFIRRQLGAGTYYIATEGYFLNGSITTNITGNTSAGYNYPTIPSSYSTNPQTGVGGMGTSFGVSPMGGATCSIPIDVPLGVGGLQPGLSIVYNSQSGNGMAGYGASLSGVSSITRGPKDIYRDSIAQGISYLADDALYLDGVRLILASGYTAGQEGAKYNPESDPFTDVISHGTFSSTSNNIWFEVLSSDGMRYRYGYDDNSQISYTTGNSPRIHSWYLCRSQQPTGNYISYKYRKNDNCIYPDSICYGGNINQSDSPFNVITFTYEARPDSIPIVFDGQHGSMKQRLKTITSKTNNTIYRSYTLNYDNSGDGIARPFSRLISVTEKNAQNQTLPATMLGWSYLPEISYASSSLTVNSPANISPFVSFPFSDQSFMSGDLNGDGLADIIGLAQVAEPNNNNGYDYHTYAYSYYASLSSTGTLQYVSGTNHVLPPSFDFGLINAAVRSSFVVDLNGEGINELIIPYFAQAGSNSGIVSLFVLGENCTEGDGGTISLHGSSKPLFTTGDVNNDGRTEVMFIETSQTNGGYPLYLWTYNPYYIPGSNNLDHGLFDMDIETTLSLSSQPKAIYSYDMNGNGLNDLLVICSNGYAVYWNQGQGVATNTYSDSFKTEGSNLKDVRSLTPGDFNGDGLIDMLSNAQGSSNWFFFLNNGDGTFNETLALNMSIISDQSFTPLDDDKVSVQTIDFDCDGRSDVVITKGVYTSGPFYGMGSFNYVITKWLYSTGSTLVEKYSATSKKSDDMYSGKYITGDFNGDGREELVNYGYDCVSGVDSNISPEWRIYRNSGLTAQTGKVISVTGDFGATTAVTYSTLTDQSVYTRGTGEPYPSPRYTIPLNVVKQTLQSNGAAGSRTLQYSYEGLKVHLRGRGLLGFMKVRSNDTTMGVINENYITQWDTLHYIPKVTYSKTIIGVLNSQTINTLTVVDKGQKRYFAYPSQTVETDMDGNSVTVTRSFDTQNGYPLSETTTYGTNMYRAINYSDYTYSGNAYRPQTVASIQRHQDDTSPFSRTTKYTYNTSGLVSQQVENYGSGAPLTTDYEYDVWGNLMSQVSTGTGITVPCTTYYIYDSTHRFPERIYTSPSSSVQKYAYDSWGNVLTEQDSINNSVNNAKTYTYDSWGNLISKNVPGCGAVTYIRGWGSDGSLCWFVLEQGLSRPWVKTWYDNQGREVKTESVGPMNISIINTTAYNNKGQVSVRSETEGNLTLSYNYTYDSRGRMTEMQGPGGNTLSYVYDNDDGYQIIDVTDNGKNTTYTYDAWGNLKRTEAPESGLFNYYSSNGGISQTFAGGASWTFGYDTRGNRTSMRDPDAGYITYTYDALGREIQRVDARGVVFSTNYDYLSRVTTVTASLGNESETIYYTYGSSGTGQMRLTAKTLGSITNSYVYDQFGRVIMKSREGYSTSYQYSNEGLLTQKTYPGGKVLDYIYDSYGNNIETSAINGTVNWDLADYTGTTYTSSITLNNTTPYIRTTQLDSYGNLFSQQLTRNSVTLQNNSYTFSPTTGNLMSRTLTGHSSESFTYDTEDRLTGVVSNNQTVMSMTYMYNGNISSKTGIGSYQYSSNSKPHAVTAVNNTDGVISEDQVTVEYNLWGKVSDVYLTDDRDTYHYILTYDADLQRVYSEEWKNGNGFMYMTYYDGGFYELYISGQVVSHYHIDGAGGNEAVYIDRSWTTPMSYCIEADHLGSVTGLYDSNGTKCFNASYDVWGRRTVSYGSIDYIWGFTGHEDLDFMGLIDMNGRMYDPRIGRFLSPDNYIQSPSDPQNYNRYSYCLNNPLKYTDLDGESIVAAIAMGLFACGMTNVFIQANNNKIDTFGDAMNALLGGMSAGISEASSWALGFAALSTGSPSGVLFGHAVNFAKSVNLTSTLVSSFANPLNASKIVLGRYYTDENGNVWDQAKQGLSRYLWEGPQTWAGYNWSQIRNIIGDVDVVDYLGGATFCINEDSSNGSVSLGNYINADLSGQYEGSIIKHPVLMHEYGHTFDSRKYGPAYLFTIGIPSLKSANNSIKINSRKTHSWYWTELRANKAAKKYFGRYYGVDWSQYENFVESKYYYPIERPVPQLLQEDYLEWYYSNY